VQLKSVLGCQAVLYKIKMYKLTYFDFGGRAESIRLAFAIGDITFEDHRISLSEFKSIKHTFPFNRVPVLTVNGAMYAEAYAILRFVGKQANLYPEDPFDCLKIDGILSVLYDIEGQVSPTMHEKDQNKKQEMQERLISEYLPSMLQGLEQIVGSENYSVGDRMTIADLEIYGFCNWFSSGDLDWIPRTFLDSFPKLKGITKSVNDHPKVQGWNEAHQ
jgi:glutathione S-transferase